MNSFLPFVLKVIFVPFFSIHQVSYFEKFDNTIDQFQCNRGVLVLVPDFGTEGRVFKSLTLHFYHEREKITATQNLCLLINHELMKKFL